MPDIFTFMRKAVAIGLAWGIFCGLANGVPVVTTLAQMAVPWVWVAVFASHRWAYTSREGAVLGGATLLFANLGYFAIGSVARALAGLPAIGGVSFFVLWTAVGLIVGPVAGLLGWWLRQERTALIAVVALATVSVAEPLALWAHIDHVDAHVAHVGVAVAGMAFPFVFRGLVRAVPGLIVTLVMAYPTAVVLEAVLIAFGQVSPPLRLI